MEDSYKGEVGTGVGSVEDQKTIKSTAPPIFPHAIPEDVQFFEPSMVIIIIIIVTINIQDLQDHNHCHHDLISRTLPLHRCHM